MPKILLTGGAGYIGSHVNLAFAEADYESLAFDNLSTGFRELVIAGELVVGDLLDKDAIDAVLRDGHFDVVVHLAAKSLVGESVKNPAMYWRNNVFGARNLLDSMLEYGPRKIVFSSTAAVYGEPEEIPMPESHTLAPLNPYGRTKLAVEWMIKDEGRANGLDYAILRYFNAAGADPEGRVGLMIPLDPHLMPVCMDVAVGKRDNVCIFGEDYPTEDGTCIRDYIHVTDLAEAHLEAAKLLLHDDGSYVMNLGTGCGNSVRQIIKEVEQVIGNALPIETIPRRPGDSAVLVADSSRAKDIINWQPRFSGLETIITTAWNWHRKTFAPNANSSD